MSRTDVVVVSTKIDRDLAQRLDLFCAEHNTNRSNFLRTLIEESLEQGIISITPTLDRATEISNEFITLLLNVRDTLDVIMTEASGASQRNPDGRSL